MNSDRNSTADSPHYAHCSILTPIQYNPGMCTFLQFYVNTSTTIKSKWQSNMGKYNSNTESIKIMV